jgi:hypothetical protein
MRLTGTQAAILIVLILAVCTVGAVFVNLLGRTVNPTYFESKPMPKPTTSLSPYREGVYVILSTSVDNVDVVLWLFYEDRCEADVVYNWVPNGTVAVLTGDVCRNQNAANFYKVRFSPEVMKGLQGKDNFWVEERYISPSK